RKSASLCSYSGVASVAPVNAAISPALNRRDGVKKTGSLMQAFSSGPRSQGPEARARLLEAGRDAEIEVLDAVAGFLLDRDRVVDAKRTEGRRPEDAGADRRTPFHVGAEDAPAGNALDIVAEQRRGIGEHGATEAEALGQQRQREL